MPNKEDGTSEEIGVQTERGSESGGETMTGVDANQFEANTLQMVADARATEVPTPEVEEQIAGLTAELKGEQMVVGAPAEQLSAEDLYSRTQTAELVSGSISLEENGSDAWRTLKNELDGGGTDYKTSMAYSDAMRTIFQRSMKEKDYDSIKQAVEIFGEDMLTEERKQGIANSILENNQLTSKDVSLIEATGIDLKNYHDQGLSKIETMINNTNLVDSSRGVLTAEDVYDWRRSFGISQEEYVEKLKEIYFKAPNKYMNTRAIPELGFTKDGKWAWD